MKYEFFNLFPTTVYVGEIDNHQKYKKSFYELYPKYDYEEDEYNNTVSENVGKPFLHLEEEISPLFEDIISHVKSYVYDVLQYKEIFEFVITKSWLSRHRDESGIEIPWHIHATSHISFVYYVSNPPNAHKIKFSDPDSKNNLWWGNKEGNRDQQRMIKEYNELNAESFFLMPPEGTVVLFPSSLLHKTEYVSHFDGERIGIVGDISVVLQDDQLKYSTGYIHPKYWKIFS